MDGYMALCLAASPCNNQLGLCYELIRLLLHLPISYYIIDTLLVVMFAFSVMAQRKKEEDREGQKERESRIVERRESLTQPVQRGFHAPLTCLAGLYKQHRHGVGGPSCTANNRTTFGGRIRAESEVEPGSSNACVNGRPGGAGQGQAFISTEEK